MILTPLAALAARVAVLLGLALAAMPLLRRAPAATRRLVLALGLGGALVLPAVGALAPAWRVSTPLSIGPVLGTPDMEPLEDGPTTAQPDRGGAPEPSARRAASAPLFSGSQIVLAIWAFGAIAVLARLALGLARTRAIVRRSGEAPAWSAAIARAERATGLRAVVRTTDDLDAPAVTGVIAPVVLVPRASATWSDERRYAVLLHELAHVRQADCFVQIVAQLACAAHWFDPLAWLVVRRLRVERELAADDAVVTAGARASTYAEDLLAIAGAPGFAREAPPGALGMAERSQLAQRVVAIVSAERPRRPLSRARSALLLSLASATLLAVACATPAAREPEPPRGPSAPLTASAALPAESAPGAATSTIDPALQAFADQQIDHAVAEWQARAGVILVLDPATGEVLASAGRANGAHADVATKSAYVTGSTLKPITLTAALEEAVVSPTDRFDCENGSFSYDGKTMHDAGAYGSLTVPEMLAVSTNIGFAKIFDRLGGARLGKWLRAFHFGNAPASIEDRSFKSAVLAIGEAMPATPLELAAAYAAFANDGAYVAPTLSHRDTKAAREQIMKPETARAVVAMLDGAVNSERATGKKAQVAGTRVAGKTGTAEYDLPGGATGKYTSFVGIVPADHPRFVILVGVEGPRGDASGGKVAAPVFAAVATRALQR